jgi:small-conductance mechanosensitive channel
MGKPEKILLTEQESKGVELDQASKEQELLDRDKEETLASFQKKIQSAKAEITQLQDKIIQAGESEFFAKKLALLNELYHTWKNIQSLWERRLALLNDTIDLLRGYVKDPVLDVFKEDLIRDQCIYSFAYLKKLHQRILDKQKVLATVIEQEEIARTELDNRKRATERTKKEFSKLREVREAASRDQERDLEFSSDQRSDIQSLEDALFKAKETLHELGIQESQQLITLNKTKKFIIKLEIGVLELTLRELKPQVRVGQAEVTLAKEDLEEARQASYAVKREYDQQIDKLDAQIKSKQAEFSALSEKVNIKAGSEIAEWAQEPQKTASSNEALCKLGSISSTILSLEHQKEVLKMRLASEDETLRAKEVNSLVQETFHKIQADDFATDEILTQELRKYNHIAASIKGFSASYQGQLALAETLLKSQKKALHNIIEWQQTVKDQEKTVFKDSVKAYRVCLAALSEVEQLIKDDIDRIGQLKNGYNDIITKLDNLIKLIEFISSELGQITIWHRPEHAVSWEGIQNVLKDIKVFIADLTHYVSNITFGSVTRYFQEYFSDMGQIVIFVIQFLIIALLLLVVRSYLPAFANVLVRFGADHSSVRFPLYILALCIGCIARHFLVISIGVLSLFIMHLYVPPETNLYMIMYLLAIPYLIYFTSRFIRCFVVFNEEHDYVFLGKDFQQRFTTVIATLLYATITICFFRAAFILGNYHRSELPTILLAINFIILQISLISLISKEQILNLIPRDTEAWELIHSMVDRYYYLLFLIVIAIIIMSNPYVGFGRLVLYILRRVFYSVGLVVFLIWAHQLFRKAVSSMFFSTDNDVTKERFPYAKTWYGVSVICLFAIVTFLGAILIAKIWNWPEWIATISSWSDLEAILKAPLGEYNEISVWTILTIIFYALGGILASYAFSKFVLDKIFDILLVNPGVQNTISSISHYIIFVTALILGFNAVGLGTLIGWFVGALAVSIGFVIKDPIGDFVAYFIILVQRPIKVGDYIQLNDSTGGVVRKITPRSIILRRKNSTTIILPNSDVLRKPVVNWNYTRGFIAFNDIQVTVSYTSDPVRAREVMHKVLSENQTILKNPRPIVRLDNFSQDGYEFTVRGYLSSSYTLDQWDIASDIRMSIFKEFTEADIELAIPVRLLIMQQAQDEEIFLEED